MALTWAACGDLVECVILINRARHSAMPSIETCTSLVDTACYCPFQIQFQDGFIIVIILSIFFASRAEDSGRKLGLGGVTAFLFDCGLSKPETTEKVDARFLPLPSTRRVSTTDGTGNEGAGEEFARLRDSASLNTAIDIVWEEFYATLSSLGHGRRGARSEVDKD